PPQPQTAKQLVTYTINNPPDPPTINVSDQTIEEGKTLTFKVTASDPDLTTVGFSAIGIPPWLTFNPATFAFDPATNISSQTATGTVPFDVSLGPDVIIEVTFTATDPTGLPASKMAKITLKNTNRPPKFNPVTPATVREGQVLKLPFKAIDPDNDKLTYRKTGGLGNFDAATLIYTLDLTNKFDVAQEGKTDEDKAIIEVDDGLGGKDQIEVTIDIVNVNRPPVIAPIGDGTIPENPNQPSDIVINATDPDLPPGQSLPKGNFSLSAVPTLPFKAEFVEGSVKLRLTPGFEDSGVYNVTVRVTDGDKVDPKTASQSFRLTVTNTNRPPTGTIDDLETSAGDTLVANISGKISDPDKDAFTFELISGPTGLGVSPSGNLTWSVPRDQLAGDVTVKVKVKDQPVEGKPGELALEFKIKVKRPNLPPVIGQIKGQKIQIGVTLTLPLTASDPDGDRINFVLGQGSVGAIQGATYTFKPEAPQTGKQFQVFITAVDVDRNGNPIPHLDKDGKPVTDPLSIASFAITVGDVVPPTIKEIADTEVKEGDTLALTFALENPPAGGVDWAFTLEGPAGRPQASLTPSGDKKSAAFKWQPGFVGKELDNNLDQTYILTVVATDTASGLFANEKVNIVVRNVNRPPQFDAAPSIMLVNEGLVLDVKASDPDGDTIFFSVAWQKKDPKDANFSNVPEFNDALGVPRRSIIPGETWKATVTARDRSDKGAQDVLLAPQQAAQDAQIPDIPAVLQVTVSGGKNSRDPVTLLATYEDPDLTPPVDNVNLRIENGTGFILERSLPKESGGNPLVGSYRFTGVFPRGTFNYTVSATGAKEAKKGSFTIVNTPPQVIVSELSSPVTGSVPINFALLDIDDDALSVSVTLDQGTPTLSRTVSPAEANQVVSVNWDSVTDLPNAAGRTERTLTISVSDGAGGFDSKSLKIKVFNKGGVPTPKLNPLPPPLPSQVDIQGVKQLRSNEAIDYGVELIINGQKSNELSPDSNNPFTFANVTLAGKNSIQTNLFALIRYTANVVESVLRQSTPDVTGKLRYSLTYQTSSRSFEVRHTGPSSDAIEAIVDDKPPEVSIISPDEVVSTNTPTLMANIKDANLDRASIQFELDGRSITPNFNPDTSLAQFTPTATNPFAAGKHKFKASAKDFSNNTASAEKDFTINPIVKDDKPPVWTSLSPNDRGRVRTRQTSIVAGVSDAQSPLNPGSVIVEVNGKPVPKDQVSFSAIDPRTGRISFTATVEKDGIVQVRVSIADNPGADKPSNLGTCSWSYEVDTIGPVAPTLVAVDCTGDEVTTVTGVAEPGATVKLIRNGAFYTEVIADLTSGAYSFLNVPLAIGENTFLAIPVDALGNVGTPSALGKTIRDEVPPAISIFSPVPNQVLATQTPSVSASLRDNCEVDESSITLEVQVSGGDVVPVTNFDYNKVTGVLSFTLPKLPDGSVFTLTVGASDTAGNQSKSSVTAQINTAITDTQPPTIANVRLAGQPVASGSAVTTRVNQPSISASVVDTDSGVKAVDIIVNGTPLNTSYDKATSTATAQPGAPQADGLYHVEIRATDKNNNTASFFFSFEVRTAVPKPGIALDPAVERTRASSIGVIASNITPDSQATWTVNGIPVFSRTFGVGEASFRREVALEPGMNKIAIEVRDVVGNTGMSDGLTVEQDVQAPEIFLVNPINGSKVKGDADISVKLLFRDASGIDESSIRIQITWIDPDTGEELEVVTQQNRLVALAPSQVGPSTEFEASRTIPNHGPDREDTYRVKSVAKDAVGNEPNQAFVASFTIDSKAPDVNILVPTSDGEVIPNSIPQLSGEIDPNNVLVSSIAVTLDGAPVAHLYNSASGQVTVEPKEFASDPNTSHALTIKAADLVGNERSVSRNFIIDTSQEDQVNPVLSGFFPLPDSTISSTNLALLSFIAADGGGINPDVVFLTINGQTVQLSGSSQAMRFDRGRFIIFLDRTRFAAQQVVSGSAPFQLDPLELSALEDPLELGALERPIGAGRNTVSIQVSDLAGNLSVAEWNFNVVTEPPDVPVLDALVKTTAQGEISVSGRVPDAPLGTTVTIFANDVIAQKLKVKADSTFTAERVLLVSGVNRISAIAADIAGNQSARSDTQTLLLDVEPPRVTINPLPAIVRDASLTVTGTVTDNSTVAFKSISIIVNKEVARDLGKAATFSAVVTLQPGDNTIQIEAVDAVGSTGSGSVTVQLNTEVPTTAPTALAGVVNSAGNGIRLTWKADTNASTYNIYRSNAAITQIGALQPIQSGVVGTEFVDISISGVTAYYAVTSVNSAGGEGKVVSNSPNVTLITSNGGVAAISDGTKVVFGRDALFKNSSLSASVTIGVVSDNAHPNLPVAIPNSIRSISVIGQSGTPVETFNKSAALTLVYPENIKDSADSPRIFELISDKWEKVENQVVDIANNTVSAQITRPGVYRLGEIQLHPWDVNGDGKVDIFDLVIVGGQFGKTPPDNLAADVNVDGTVNIFDLVLVGSHFGEIIGSTAAAPVALNRTSASDVEMRMVAEVEKSAPALGNLVTIRVHANSSVKLGGVHFDLRFDTQRLSIVEATKGGWFEAQGSQSYWLPPKVADGRLTLASVALSPLPSPTALGEGPGVREASVFAQIPFRVKGDVNAAMESIRMENVQVADLDGQSILANWQNRVDITSLTKRSFQNALLQNYPNPFNPETWMPYTLAEDAHVIITIYNVLGQPVRKINLGFVPAGEYTSKERASYWDGRNERGEPVASGMYFYTIQAGKFVASKKLVVLK
ncbi:T9SS type A sorting domain-containing protein, partial [Candidatus Poribacteria bacterium]|nr:T9SS type A sorting domain-containing protein [Candidatus Poribacteria bacterium]